MAAHACLAQCGARNAGGAGGLATNSPYLVVARVAVTGRSGARAPGRTPAQITVGDRIKIAGQEGAQTVHAHSSEAGVRGGGADDSLGISGT